MFFAMQVSTEQLKVQSGILYQSSPLYKFDTTITFSSEETVEQPLQVVEQ